MLVTLISVFRHARSMDSTALHMGDSSRVEARGGIIGQIPNMYLPIEFTVDCRFEYHLPGQGRENVC